MTTKNDIMKWFDAGVQDNDKWMIVIADTFSYENYPSYFKTRDDMIESRDNADDEKMLRVMEVYDLTANRDYQISLPMCRADVGTV